MIPKAFRKNAWRRQIRHIGLLLIFLVEGLGGMANSNARASEIRSDEEVLFFPTLGRLSEDGRAWILPVHGWIFEPEEGDLLRVAALDAAANALELPAGSSRDAVFRERIRWFLVDNERGKHITIEIAGSEHTLPRSTPDGHFSDELRLPVEVVLRHAVDGWLTYRAQVDADDDRQFTGRIQLLERTGVSVISDIDDTIKITEVTSRERLLARTFLEPFEAVPGMAVVYQRWVDQGAAVHLVSNGPWQLYPSLQEIFARETFPETTWSMRRFRLKDRTGIEFLIDGRQHKVEEITRCLEWFPERQFILVGDTGEQDPEIYGDIAHRHPDRVRLILLRNVTEEAPDNQRMQNALHDLPAARWRLFAEAVELELVDIMSIVAESQSDDL